MREKKRTGRWNLALFPCPPRGLFVHYLVALGATARARRHGHGPPRHGHQPVDAEGYEGEHDEEHDDYDCDGVVFFDHFGGVRVGGFGQARSGPVVWLFGTWVLEWMELEMEDGWKLPLRFFPLSGY